MKRIIPVGRWGMEGHSGDSNGGGEGEVTGAENTEWRERKRERLKRDRKKLG